MHTAYINEHLQCDLGQLPTAQSVFLQCSICTTTVKRMTKEAKATKPALVRCCSPMSSGMGKGYYRGSLRKLSVFKILVLELKIGTVDFPRRQHGIVNETCSASDLPSGPSLLTSLLKKYCILNKLRLTKSTKNSHISSPRSRNISILPHFSYLPTFL